MRNKTIAILTMGLFFALTGIASGQTSTPDTLTLQKSRFANYKPLIIPTTLIGYGIVGLNNNRLKRVDINVKERINERNRYTKTDDFCQYAPALSVYLLNIAGIKGKHNFRDRTIIFATAHIIMSTTVTGLKHTVKRNRPDSNASTAFPSGHTATAFMTAEFLFQEYKDVSIWYGISGYLVATATGFLRVYNHRHWVTDVTTGAGIGILSTKIAYWITPYITEKLFKNRRNKQTTQSIYPYYNGQQLGMGLLVGF